jgi:enoyl-CoA hydratase/carnithine racemase
MIKVEDKAGVAWVTLDRPDVRNALSRELNVKLTDIASELEANDDVRAIVLTGTGDKAFCAGADLKERRGVPAAESGMYINAIATAIESWGEIRKPTIAMMNGSAYGGGLELAMACDLRVLVDGAELGLTEVRLGIMPGAGGTQRLPRLVGEARAKEIGLVHQVVARDKLRAAVDTILAELAGCAPLSVRAAKSAIERGHSLSLSDGLAIERECYDTTLYTEDRDEGLAAFAEGRPPKYLGR